MYGLRNCRPMLEGDRFRFGCTPMDRRVLDPEDAEDTTSRSNDKQKRVRIAALIALALLSSATRTDFRLNAVSYHFCGSDILGRFMNTTPYYYNICTLVLGVSTFPKHASRAFTPSSATSPVLYRFPGKAPYLSYPPGISHRSHEKT